MRALSPTYTQSALERLAFEGHNTPDMTTAITYLNLVTAVDLVVSDVMMPGGTGVALLHAVRRARRLLSAAGRVSLAHAYRWPGRGENDGGRARWL